MNRTEIETKLNRDRAWLLEQYAGLSADDLVRDATASEHDSTESWSAKDHLAHLIGIEKSFNGMVRRHLAGDAEPVGLSEDADGTRRSREEIMASVHKGNEDWVAGHRAKSLSEVIAAGQETRAETLALLAELSDEQLQDKLPGAPWGDGAVGTILAINADHGRQHWSWARKGLGIESAEPAPAARMAALFQGKSVSQQKALLAELERGGAALYRAFAQDEQDEAAREALLAAAAREEENAEVLENSP